MTNPSPNQAQAQTVTVKLDQPLTRTNGDAVETITEITLREPRSGELRGLLMVQLGNGDQASLVKLLPRISTPNLSEQEINALSASDFMAITGEIIAFLMPASARREFETR